MPIWASGPPERGQLLLCELGAAVPPAHRTFRQLLPEIAALGARERGQGQEEQQRGVVPAEPHRATGAVLLPARQEGVFSAFFPSAHRGHWQALLLWGPGGRARLFGGAAGLDPGGPRGGRHWQQGGCKAAQARGSAQPGDYAHLADLRRTHEGRSQLRLRLRVEDFPGLSHARAPDSARYSQPGGGPGGLYSGGGAQWGQPVQVRLVQAVAGRGAAHRGRHRAQRAHDRAQAILLLRIRQDHHPRGLPGNPRPGTLHGRRCDRSGRNGVFSVCRHRAHFALFLGRALHFFCAPGQPVVQVRRQLHHCSERKDRHVTECVHAAVPERRGEGPHLQGHEEGFEEAGGRERGSGSQH
mmetsp:Transcript_5596/g.14021  ORF Transcript_5596/g.14021 Transcript_5596/m.14021 type:complete len:355 (+) Transcript_5596:154-1218(+)